MTTAATLQTTTTTGGGSRRRIQPRRRHSTGSGVDRVNDVDDGVDVDVTSRCWSNKRNSGSGSNNNEAPQPQPQPQHHHHHNNNNSNSNSNHHHHNHNVIRGAYQTYQWRPDPQLSVDDNYMDLTLLVTRSSQLKQGSMACLLVRQRNETDDHHHHDTGGGGDDDDTVAIVKTNDNAAAAVVEESSSNHHHHDNSSSNISNTDNNDSLSWYYWNRIIAISTNLPLYQSDSSDIHAEIAAIGQAAARCSSGTAQCTAYITMPPCRKCFGALVCAKVARIVTPRTSPLASLAAQHGIQMIALTEQWDDRRQRTNEIVRAYHEQQKTARGG